MHKLLSILILVLLLTACAPIVTLAAPTPTVEPVGITPTVELTETPILWATNTPTQTDAEKAANTSTPLPPTATATPGIQPPACTFPLAQTTMEESKPEKYTFSEPKIVSNSNAGIEIVEWLPDSQRVLITRSIQNTPNKNIELFNPQTGETHVYAVGRNPIWIEKAKSIIYSDWLLVSTPIYDKGMVVPSSIIGRQQLWLTSGNPANAQMLEDVQYSSAIVPHEWVTSSIAVKPDGSQIVYLKSAGEIPWRLYSRMVSQDGLKAEQQSVIQGNYGGEGVWLASDKMSWRPSTSQIFFYHEV